MTVRLDRFEWLGFLGLLLGAAILGLLAGVSPKFAIGVAFASGFVLLVFTNLAAGVAVFGFFSFLELIQISSVLSVGKLGGVLLAGGWLARVATKRDVRASFSAAHPGIALLLTLFLAWTLLSIVWAPFPGLALGSAGRYAINVTLFIIVFTAIRTPDQARFLVGAFVAGSLAAALYGVVESSGGNAIYAGRLAGTSLDPNELASTLVAGAALAISMTVGLAKSPAWRLAASGAAVLCLGALFLTVSRGGLVSLTISLVAAMFFAGRWRGRIAVTGLLIAGITVYYFAYLAPQDARDRLTQSTQGEAVEKEGRATIWTVGRRMAADHPVNGVGAGNFEQTARNYVLEPGTLARSDVIISTPQVAHNTYLQVLAEEGLVGLGLFCGLILFCLVSVMRAAKNFSLLGDRGSEALARGMCIALIGTLSADFFISQNYNKQLWFLLGLCPTLLAVSRRQMGTEAA